MRRPMAVLALLFCSLTVANAPAATAAPKRLSALFAKQIAAINRAKGTPPVLLPRTLALDARHLYPSGGPVGTAYELELGAVRGCHGANACFVAAFAAERGAKVYGRRVTVKGASRAGYRGLSCGASCSPPQVDFIVHGIRYAIQANLASSHGNRETLIRAAESAIAAGAQ